jgi:hypothetical protein
MHDLRAAGFVPAVAAPHGRGKLSGSPASSFL